MMLSYTMLSSLWLRLLFYQYAGSTMVHKPGGWYSYFDVLGTQISGIATVLLTCMGIMRGKSLDLHLYIVYEKISGLDSPPVSPRHGATQLGYIARPKWGNKCNATH
jgi:hypothetical protein